MCKIVMKIITVLCKKSLLTFYVDLNKIKICMKCMHDPLKFKIKTC